MSRILLRMYVQTISLHTLAPGGVTEAPSMPQPPAPVTAKWRFTRDQKKPSLQQWTLT